MVKVRDELSGHEYETSTILWSATLERTTPQTAGAVTNYGWRNPMTDAHKAWARAADPMDDRWMPVEVLP